jgi:predicted O-methyltransferase YrrM
MATIEAESLLGVIEEALVSHRAFGDSEYILAEFQTSCKRRLEAISAGLPSAGRLLEALGRASEESVRCVTGTTVIRSAIQHAHTQVETGEDYGIPLADCDGIFADTALHLERGEAGTPFERGAGWLPRLGEQDYQPWIWREDHPDDVFGRSFRHLVRENYTDPLCTPSEADLAALRRGEELLQALVPQLTRSALTHVQLVGVFPHTGAWKDKASSSQIRVGGSVFLGRTLMRSPWVVAEHLLHEALHQKLYDFRHGHNLLEPDFAKRGAPRVRSPWNPAGLNEANSWDTHRAFAAFHVYAQLTLLARVAEERSAELESEFGSSAGLIPSHKAFARAWYLGEQLRTTAWEVLGLAGRRMVEWLTAILEALEPAPPPEGARLHLVLDLYRREARRVGARLTEPDHSSPALLTTLAPLAEKEIATARGALETTGAATQVEELDEAVDGLSAEELASRFGDVREVVAEVLLDASADGYVLAPEPGLGEGPDAVVERMVLDSSERLHREMNGIPASVAAARKRANRLRVTNSSLEEVGRLLSVLAAAVPDGGRILEIGTSVGVGMAWICEGLGERTDVEVVGLEIRPELVEAALEWPWPEHVTLLNEDAVEALGRLGEFDLVFVDAAPIKLRQIDAAMAAIGPHGILVIDDMRIGAMNPEQQRREKELLRAGLAASSEMRAVELDWASQVILAARAG